MIRLALAAAVMAATVAAVLLPRTGIDFGGDGNAASSAPREPSRTELPDGGTSVLPEHRVVAFYGAPPVRELGTLGIGTPREAGKRLLQRAEAYSKRSDSRPVLPAFELISSVAQSGAGDDGLYTRPLPERVLHRYLEAARRIHALLLLDIQPGRASFPDLVRKLEPFLREPDVGVALDPEWRMGHNQIPGQVIGHVRASEVNRVTDYISGIVEEDHLPDKLMVIHQFTPHMIRDRKALIPRSGIDLVLNSDGFGSPGAKRERYGSLAPQRGSPFFRGFKLFYEEDTELMTPREVLRLTPRPVDFVVYE